MHIHLFNVNPYVQTFFQDVLGRASVPLLSVTSGLLMVGYFKRPFKSALLGRFQVLILPLLFWSLVGWFIYSALDGSFNFDIVSTFHILPSTQMIHLAFLRDLFILACMTPLLIKLLKLSPYVLLPLLAIGLFIPTEPVLLRGQILCYYSIGLFFALYNVRIPKTPVILLVSAFLCVSVFVVAIQPQSIWVDNFLLRPLTAWTFWVIASSMAVSVIATTIQKIEPAVFLLFLSHPLVGRILTGAYNKTGLEIDTVFWLALPFICYLIAIIGRTAITSKWIPNWVSVVLIGKA